MTKLRDLLARGYFARELPPPFTTDIYARIVTLRAKTLPTSFTDVKKLLAKFALHDIPNLGLRRRVTGLPNPILHYNLCKTIVDNWNLIDSHCQSSHLSHSHPTFSPTGRAVVPSYTESQLAPIRSRIRALSKYSLKADISRFYPSLYTHSIPWALHTKPAAKVNKKGNILGNILDQLVRNGQDGQTIGIPIGTDTSLIISEIVLSAFDNNLNKDMPQLRGFRYVDDFEFGFRSYSEAEDGLAMLRSNLREFDLDLNTQKTSIINLPSPVDKPWVSQLREYPLNGTPRKQNTQLKAYFNNSLEFANSYPSDHVLKYAIPKLKSTDIAEENWFDVETFLFQCIMAESNTFFPVLTLLKKYHELEYPINLDDLELLMNFQITQRCSANHGNEVAWAVWALIFWDRQISEDAAKELGKMRDSIVALLTLDAQSRGLISKGLNTSLWETYMQDEKNLYDSMWLLTYEANIKGWLTPTIDPIAKDKNFEFLRQHKVEFYDPRRVKQVTINDIWSSQLNVPLFSF